MRGGKMARAMLFCQRLRRYARGESTGAAKRVVTQNAAREEEGASGVRRERVMRYVLI